MSISEETKNQGSTQTDDHSFSDNPIDDQTIIRPINDNSDPSGEKSLDDVGELKPKKPDSD